MRTYNTLLNEIRLVPINYKNEMSKLYDFLLSYSVIEYKYNNWSCQNSDQVLVQNFFSQNEHLNC